MAVPQKGVRCAAFFLCGAENAGVKGAALWRSSPPLPPTIGLHNGQGNEAHVLSCNSFNIKK
jgi:hypothetical protein